MSEPKLNKDGLQGGKLVTPKEHAAVMLKNRQAAAKSTKKS